MARGSVNSWAGPGGSGFGPTRFPEAGHASNAKHTQEVAVTPTGQAGPLSSGVKTNASGSVGLKEMCTAQYFFFFACVRDLGEETHTLRKINQRQDWGAGKTNSQCDWSEDVRMSVEWC